MYFVKCKAEDNKNVLINPKDIRWVKEENESARVEFLNGEQITVLCADFDDLEQKILDASMPEIDLKSYDGIKVFVEGAK